MSDSWVWILPEDHHFYFVWQATVQCIENFLLTWKNTFGIQIPFGINEIRQFFEIAFFRFRLQDFLPVFMQLLNHVAKLEDICDRPNVLFF